ncbi:MAG: hypothetical protein QM790_11655 [Nibricoccus sp.]
MKWLKVVVVGVLLSILSGVLVVAYVRHSKALAVEQKLIFQEVYSNTEITSRVGPVKDAAFAYGRQGKSRKTGELWTREKNDGIVIGSARLNFRAQKAWGRISLTYRYAPETGEFRVTDVELDQLEAAEATGN